MPTRLRASFRGDENALGMDSGDGCKVSRVHSVPLTVHFQMVEMVNLMCFLLQQKMICAFVCKSQCGLMCFLFSLVPPDEQVVWEVCI